MNKEDEILVAQYMGMVKTDKGWYDAKHKLHYNDEDVRHYDELKFSTECNWVCALTDQVEADSERGIKTINISTSKGETMTSLNGGQFIGVDWFEESSTLALFKASIHWIKWFKKIKNPKTNTAST